MFSALLSGTFEYIDCYNDNIDIFDLNNVAIRDLNGDLIRTNNMTPEYCIRHCRDKGRYTTCERELITKTCPFNDTAIFHVSKNEIF